MKRTPLRRVSEAQRLRNNEWKKATSQRRVACEYRCEASVAGVCDGYGCHGHHVIRRSQGGPQTVDNCRWVCRPCHAYLHNNVMWAMSMGLLKSATASGPAASPPRAETTCEPPSGASSAALAVAATPGGIPIVYTSDALGWAAAYGVRVWDGRSKA